MVEIASRGNGGGPAGVEPPRSGAIGGLVGALGSLSPEHQNAKEKPRENEELTTDSHSDSLRPKSKGEGSLRGG